MKNQIVKYFTLGTIAAATALGTVHAAPGGTDVLHFFVRESFTGEGEETGIVGNADAKQNTQGKANNQRLDLSFGGLNTNTSYHLYAIIDTDDSNYTHVAEITSDALGNAAVRYSKVGNGKGLGKKKSALPAVLTPLSDIRELALFNSNTQRVAVADFTSPDKLQYLIKRNVSTNDVTASLRIKATTTQTQFRLTATGLEPDSSYHLAFNEEVVESVTSDAAGRLNYSAMLSQPEEILDLRSVALWNTTSNVVLSAELP